ncbi:MAG: hypothetical protein M1825_006523 [Sarcosagium campestre]|nr:MAG: hypothetical protein M1825_006523 [Sarcosagium campestre]
MSLPLHNSASTGSTLAATFRDHDSGAGTSQGSEYDIDQSSIPIPVPEGHQLAAGHALGNSLRRTSAVSGARRPSFLASFHRRASGYLTDHEREDVIRQEQDLLRDNHLIPEREGEPLMGALCRYVSPQRSRSAQGGSSAGVGSANDAASETSALLPKSHLGNGGSPDDFTAEQWEDAVLAGKIKTTWRREARTLTSYSWPLIIMNLLEYSLTVTSIIAVGRLGKLELGAASLASVTANISGYAIYYGLATSLDTLCAQAYGSGRKQLVGLQTQRMVWFLWVATIPIGIVWLYATEILRHVIPEPEIAELAGLYLKIVLIGAPGIAAFEAGKRFVMSQGLFSACMWVLLICAPLNVFLNWLFVWRLHLGFVGAPIAVAIVQSLLPLLLVLYVYLVAGRDCWNGLTTAAFHNWLPMIKLSLPGLVMIEAEVLAFEILTLAASYLSTTHLAAQSVLASLAALTFQIPFPLSIAASTRIANLIGATLSDAARTSAAVALVGAALLGIFDMLLLSSLRHVVPRLFTDDPDVIEVVAGVVPVCAAFQLFDALATNCNGILRGLGRQSVGGWVNLFCYYVIALPISLTMTFVFGWGLYGFWGGIAIGLMLVAAIEGWFIYRTSWDQVVEDARRRNELG